LNSFGGPPISVGVINEFERKCSMPAILLWLLGVPIPVIILLVLLWH
jgi:hypothetical protein